MLLDEVNKHLVVDVASAHDDHVLTEVVALMKVCDHVACDLSDVVDIAKNGLAHHMIFEHIEVNVLHQGLLGILISRLQLLPDRVLLELQQLIVIDTVTEHIAHDLD